MATPLLLVVAAGLMLVAASYVTRQRGAEAGTGVRIGMAAMTGLALSFLIRVLVVLPLVVFPMAMTGILVASWLSRGRLDELGAFLVAGGGLWALDEVYARLNDVSDPAVIYPGWTPIPLALAVALTVLGGALIAGVRLQGRS